jgi:hypothetical protein
MVANHEDVELLALKIITGARIRSVPLLGGSIVTLKIRSRSTSSIHSQARAEGIVLPASGFRAGTMAGMANASGARGW